MKKLLLVPISMVFVPLAFAFVSSDVVFNVTNDSTTQSMSLQPSSVGGTSQAPTALEPGVTSTGAIGSIGMGGYVVYSYSNNVTCKFNWLALSYGGYSLWAEPATNCSAKQVNSSTFSFHASDVPVVSN